MRSTNIIAFRQIKRIKRKKKQIKNNFESDLECKNGDNFGLKCAVQKPF